MIESLGWFSMGKTHTIRTYMDGWKCVRYCTVCTLEEDDKRWTEPCIGKIVVDKAKS